MILCVLNTCTRDESLAVASLGASERLDGRLDAAILVMSDVSFDASRVIAAAQRAFAHVHHHAYDTWLGDQAWPTPQNWAWQQTARFLYDQRRSWSHHAGWLWWEPDATPIRKGWLAALTDAYLAEPRTPFAGVPCVARDNTHYMNGVGIYPFDIVDQLANSSALYTRTLPFDQQAGHAINQRGLKPLDHLIKHVRKPAGGKPGVTFTADDVSDLFATCPTHVFYHGCDATLPNLVGTKLAPRRKQTRNTQNLFYHSGDRGDIIYALTSIRALGGGTLCLGPEVGPRGRPTRCIMSEETAQEFADLLAGQSYIDGVEYVNKRPRGALDFNAFGERALLEVDPPTRKRHRIDRVHTLIELQAEAVAAKPTTEPWLDIAPTTTTLPYIVIARSSRYQNDAFPWQSIVHKWRAQLLFAGHANEHADFILRYGYVRWKPTHNLLALAQVIAGARCFIGNQSLPYALAIAQGKPTVLETWPTRPDCILSRPQSLHSTTDFDAIQQHLTTHAR